ncbi:hypothetical protein RV00_GL001885 [Enterococcus devriesei]|uniref:Uncharacterized protein n=1 Tax=Enterococcus devriesei TaxID=319970 RepID=A0A1L8SX27_9ENTE|nr:hypothetical protein RV00_GL001885 [Enterococcus devriesei]
MAKLLQTYRLHYTEIFQLSQLKGMIFPKLVKLRLIFFYDAKARTIFLKLSQLKDT